jgi:septum formation protein
MQGHTLILASGSPRRRELIPLLGLPWEVWPANVDEDSVEDVDPETNVMRTAQLKASAVAGQAPSQAVVVAADTTVALNGQMLNKPADEADARSMLLSLRGRTHRVYTGIAVVNKSTAQMISDVATIEVPMREYSIDEIEAYISSGDPMDKAGAYAIQHPVFQPVFEMSGCYAGVVGLPLCHLVRALRRVGVAINAEVAAACQAHHGYDCPVFEHILSRRT